jgi:hypothetical protein
MVVIISGVMGGFPWAHPVTVVSVTTMCVYGSKSISGAIQRSTRGLSNPGRTETTGNKH